MNKKQMKLFKKHPAEKSLSVFPIIPKEKSSFVSRKGSKDEKKVFLNFNTSSSCYSIDNFDRLRELQAFRHTNSVLEKVEMHLPNNRKKRLKESKILSLPPIINVKDGNPRSRSQRHLNQEARSKASRGKSYSGFILPVVSREECFCSCSRNTNEKIENARLKSLSKIFRPEETPPLFSLYVRWKNRRNGQEEYNHDSLHEIFNSFGEISKVIMKSRSSAVVIFTEIEAACNAAKVMQQSMGKEMKMHVKWFGDIQYKC